MKYQNKGDIIEYLKLKIGKREQELTILNERVKRLRDEISMLNNMISEEEEVIIASSKVEVEDEFQEHNSGGLEKITPYQPTHEKGREKKYFDVTKFRLPYSEAINQANKIYAALHEMSKGKVEDITKYILYKEPALNHDQTFVWVRNLANKLYQDDSIGAKKIGNKNEYFFFGGVKTLL